MALVASRRHVLLSRLFVLPTAAGHARQGKKKKKSVSSRHATCRWRLSLRTASVRITVQHISQHGRLPPRDRSEGWGWRREGGRRQEEDMYTFSRNWNTVRLFSFLLVTDRDLASLCHQSKRKKKQNKATVPGQTAQCSSQCDGLLRSRRTVGDGNTASPLWGFEEKSAHLLHFFLLLLLFLAPTGKESGMCRRIINYLCACC